MATTVFVFFFFLKTDVNGLLYVGKLSGLLSVGGGRKDRLVEFGKTTTGARGRRSIRAKRGEFTDCRPPRIPLDSALSRFSVDGREIGKRCFGDDPSCQRRNARALCHCNYCRSFGPLIQYAVHTATNTYVCDPATAERLERVRVSV